MKLVSHDGKITSIYNIDQNIDVEALDRPSSQAIMIVDEGYTSGISQEDRPLPNLAPEPTIENVNSTKLYQRKRFIQASNFMSQKVANIVSENERASWSAKEHEARSWQENNSFPTPIMDAEILKTSESKQDLSEKIINRADIYKPLSGSLSGIRRKYENDMDLLDENTPEIFIEIENLTRGAIEELQELFNPP